jgi:hypothetical protein
MVKAMIEWYQDIWKHKVTLKDGTELFPDSIHLSSATRDDNGKAIPALFCQWGVRERIQSIGGSMQWIPWTDVLAVETTKR